MAENKSNKSSIYIYNRGEFESLDPDFLKNKAIIRIHNRTDQEWYKSVYPNGIELFFEDVDTLSFLEKIKATRFESFVTCFTKSQAIDLLQFIRKNKNKDFLIHCQYGKSRSVAVGLFIRENFKGTIVNREEVELKTPNVWVLELLNKVNL